MKEKITICIPTKNRSDFLFRLLNYFTATNYQHWIFIGDSSNDLHFAKTKKTIQSLKGKLKIKHFKYPGLNVAEVIELMNQFITTPYSVFSADDDFLCPNGVNKCIDFLDGNPDYNVVQGIDVGTRNYKSGPYGNISYVHYCQGVKLDADSGSQRLRDFFATGPYALIHYIHRTPEWRELYQGFISVPWARQGFSFDDLTFSTVSAIRNKVKKLDCLYLLRFGHDRVYHQVDVYDWFTNQDWFPGFKDLHDRAINELMRQDNICKNEAEEVFKGAFWPYLARLFSPGLSYKRRGVLFSLLRKTAKQIPTLQKLYFQIIFHFQAKKEINLLPSLLKPTSPYHEDFMPIYRAITSPKNIQKNDKL